MRVHKTKFIKEARLGWLMTGPSLIVIGAIAVYPILYTMWLSLHAFNLKEPAAGKPFVGLANYWAFFTDPQALGGLWNTVIYRGHRRPGISARTWSSWDSWTV